MSLLRPSPRSELRRKNVKPVEYVSGNGPLRAVLRRNHAYLSLFAPAVRKKILAKAGRQAVRNWRAMFFVKRFKKEIVSGPPWNYHYGGKHPMIGPHRGNEKLRNVIYRGKIRVVYKAKGDRFRIDASLPYGHPVKPYTSRPWLIVPPNEVQFIADELQKGIDAIAELGGGAHMAVTSRSNRYPARVNERQRQALGIRKRRRSTRRSGSRRSA